MLTRSARIPCGSWPIARSSTCRTVRSGSQQDALRQLEERKAQQEAARARIVMITAGELADLHGEIAELRKEVAALQVQLAVATNPAVAAVPAPPTRQPVDPLILKAIRDHELAPGMTVEQAERSLGPNRSSWKSMRKGNA